jgi:hypothetical protein
VFVRKKASKKSTLAHVVAEPADKSDQIRAVIEIAADLELPSDAERFRSRVEELLMHFGATSVCKRVRLYFDENPYVKKRKVMPEINATYTKYDRIDEIYCDGKKYYVHAEEEVYGTPEHEIVHSYRVKVVSRS